MSARPAARSRPPVHWETDPGLVILWDQIFHIWLCSETFEQALAEAREALPQFDGEEPPPGMPVAEAMARYGFYTSIVHLSASRMVH